MKFTIRIWWLNLRTKLLTRLCGRYLPDAVFSQIDENGRWVQMIIPKLVIKPQEPDEEIKSFCFEAPKPRTTNVYFGENVRK